MANSDHKQAGAPPTLPSETEQEQYAKDKYWLAAMIEAEANYAEGAGETPEDVQKYWELRHKKESRIAEYERRYVPTSRGETTRRNGEEAEVPMASRTTTPGQSSPSFPSLSPLHAALPMSLGRQPPTFAQSATSKAEPAGARVNCPPWS
ncbi:Nn.00g089870.m01.CDS01 [Neocucurbitaria sp. VM-36]